MRRSEHTAASLKLRATHLAPPAYAHLKEFVVLSGRPAITARLAAR